MPVPMGSKMTKGISGKVYKVADVAEKWGLKNETVDWLVRSHAISAEQQDGLVIIDAGQVDKPSPELLKILEGLGNYVAKNGKLPPVIPFRRHDPASAETRVGADECAADHGVGQVGERQKPAPIEIEVGEEQIADILRQTGEKKDGEEE